MRREIWMDDSMTSEGDKRFRAPARPGSPHIKNYVALGILVWFLGALAAGWLNFFSQPNGPPIRLGLCIGVPIAVLVSLYGLSASFRAFTRNISLSVIVGAHVWRYVGLGFVVAFMAGKLPPQFGIPEGLGDIIAAAFALPLARAIHHDKPVRHLFVAWNVFGLVDLISAITLGVLYSQSAWGILRTGVSTQLMVSFPVSLIPTFFVPLFILLHVLALIRRNEVMSPAVAIPNLPSRTLSADWAEEWHADETTFLEYGSRRDR